MTALHLETSLLSMEMHTILDASITKTKYVSIDLSINNEALQTINCASSKELETFIWKHIASHNAKVAYGGYLEPRAIYQRSKHFNPESDNENRNIHLGLDLWTEVKSPIFAPISGTVHSFKNNTNFGDYGPTMILKHEINNVEFHTLYGHLSLESIQNLKVGSIIEKGQQIATLGDANVNGDYPPHLHFQIIKDIGNYKGDYPGVCSQKDLEFYKKNCPNPSLLIF